MAPLCSNVRFQIVFNVMNRPHEISALSQADSVSPGGGLFLTPTVTDVYYAPRPSTFEKSANRRAGPSKPAGKENMVPTRQTLARSKVDEFVPRAQDVNLREGRAGKNLPGRRTWFASCRLP